MVYCDLNNFIRIQLQLEFRIDISICSLILLVSVCSPGVYEVCWQAFFLVMNMTLMYIMTLYITAMYIGSMYMLPGI